MFIELQDIRDAHQAANPADYAKHYDDAYVKAYNAVFQLFVDAVKQGVSTGEYSAANLDALSYPTLEIKSAVLSTATLAQVSGLAEAVMIAHDHGRDEGCNDAFVDAVSTALEQLSR
jgi:hypothetical protein